LYKSTAVNMRSFNTGVGDPSLFKPAPKTMAILDLITFSKGIIDDLDENKTKILEMNKRRIKMDNNKEIILKANKIFFDINSYNT